MKNLPLGLVLRWAEPGDSLAIAVLELASAKLENRAEPIDLSVSQMQRVWDYRLKVKDGFNTIVATQGAAMLGFLCFDGAVKDGHVLALYIDPAHMRQGIGTALLNTAEQLVRQVHGRELKVEVETENHFGIKFYQALGFKTGESVNSHLFKMSKEL